MAITSMVFDSSYYLTQNQDVLAAVVAGTFTSAESHWDLFGYKELRDPNASFDTSYYLQSNPDIVAAGVNALTHFMEFGAGEGRAPTAALANISATFDSTTYLAANADVASAVNAGSFKNAYEHWVKFGQFEGRAAQDTSGTSLSSSGAAAAAEAGATAVIQPGGSIRDDEVISAADDAGLSMVFTGMRHFRH